MTIRRDFPALNPAQVQQILGEYQLGPGKSRPRGWFPPPEEVEPALRTGKLRSPFFSLTDFVVVVAVVFVVVDSFGIPLDVFTLIPEPF